jgi:hypothetical protein
MKRLVRLLLSIALVYPLFLQAAPGAPEARFSTTTGEVKRADGSTWSVTVTELERTPRQSVLGIETTGRLPSVGSSLFIACSVLKLARERGFRYVAQKDEGGRIQLGFLDRIEDDAAKALGPAFANLAPGRKYDAEFVAPICDAPQPPAPPVEAPPTKGAVPAPK